jgi:hypothetical protein
MRGPSAIAGGENVTCVATCAIPPRQGRGTAEGGGWGSAPRVAAIKVVTCAVPVEDYPIHHASASLRRGPPSPSR